MKLEKFLHKTYYDPENNASFSSVNKLYKITKDKFPTVTLELYSFNALNLEKIPCVKA